MSSGWESTIGMICYQDGWYDFAQGQFHEWGGSVEEPMTTVIIPRTFPKRPTQETHRQLLALMAPVFNDKDCQRDCILQFFARSMAGMVVDKQWMVAIGERDSGKGFQLALMASAFGSYVKSCNSENFLYTGPIKDPAKKQSWMLDFEYTRLCYSNEITIDDKGEAKLDGNQIKRFSSGGDELCARKNFQDETYFRTQTHQLICCNDLCPIAPSDAKETGILFDMPTKFVDKDDPKLKQIQHNTHEIVFKKKDDGVKTLAQTPDMIDAFTWAILDAFQDHAVRIPESMQESNNQFRKNDGECEKDVFHAQFKFTGNSSDSVPIKELKYRVRELRLAITPQRYNKWLRAKQCTTKNIGTEQCWIGLELIKLFDKADIAPGGSFGGF